MSGDFSDNSIEESGGLAGVYGTGFGPMRMRGNYDTVVAYDGGVLELDGDTKKVIASYYGKATILGNVERAVASDYGVIIVEGDVFVADARYFGIIIAGGQITVAQEFQNGFVKSETNIVSKVVLQGSRVENTAGLNYLNGGNGNGKSQNGHMPE